MTDVPTVIPPSESRVIRFAVGSEDKPTSFVCRLWTTREDAYLCFTPRPYPKVSNGPEVMPVCTDIDLPNAAVHGAYGVDCTITRGSEHRRSRYWVCTGSIPAASTI